MARRFLMTMTVNNGSVQALGFDSVQTADLPTTLPPSVGAGNSGAPNDASLLGGTGFKTGISCENLFTDMTVGNGFEEGISCLTLLKPSTAPAATNNARGIDSEIATDPSVSFNFHEVHALFALAAHEGSGTITAALIGIETQVENVGSGTVAQAQGVAISLTNTGTLTAGYGLVIGSPINTGTWHNNYGVYISDQSAVGDTNSYNLYSAGAGKNYFGGPVGIGSLTPSASAALEVDSTTQGVAFPQMTTAQKNAIASPREGLVVYDITLHKLCVRTAAAWETITSS